MNISPDAPGDDFVAHMTRGASLHAALQPQLALAEFEMALALNAGDINAVSACAALLTELARPDAAYRLLQSVRSQLLLDADGAANLAIAAETCGDYAQARQCYERALQLQPNHLRTLNNLGLMASREGLKDTAISYARRCLELRPDQHAFWLNLSDFLTAARRYDEAIAHLSAGLQRFPDSDELALRSAVVLAFQAKFMKSAQAFAALRPEVLTGFDALLAHARPANNPDGTIQKPPVSLPDPYQLYTRSAFEAIQLCDWRECDRLAATLRHMLAECLKTGKGRDLRDAQHYGIALGLHESELAQMREISIATIASNQTRAFPAFVRRPVPHRDGRIHVGIAIQSLREPRFADGLAKQLQMHDHTRFCLHLYSPTPQPQEYLIQALNAPSVQVAEIAHMTDDEAAARMRFDQLDIFLDMAFDTPWCRPEIPSRRVAPVQIRQLTWHRHNPPQPCEYNLSDTFVHPDSNDLARYGAIIRFPHTCWIDACNGLPESSLSLQDMRVNMGIHQDHLVLCSFLPGIMIDPLTFASWMQILRAVPDAVLWLPAFRQSVQANLRREAASAGVEGSRLVFWSGKGAGNARTELLARMPLADLFVDALRFNANSGLVDALRMGVPAISCAGNSMASRLGGSIIRAAGLQDCVFDNQASYLAAAIELGQDRSKLARFRAQLQAARSTAPLFDAQARVRECEAAWTVMAERSWAGLPPIAFDVPAFVS
jgi:protein O-GlcNAc transferase